MTPHDFVVFPEEKGPGTDRKNLSTVEVKKKYV